MTAVGQANGSGGRVALRQWKGEGRTMKGKSRSLLISGLFADRDEDGDQFGAFLLRKSMVLRSLALAFVELFPLIARIANP